MNTRAEKNNQEYFSASITELALKNKEKYIVSTELVWNLILQNFVAKKLLQIYPLYGKNFCEKNGLEFVAIESLPEHEALLGALSSAGMEMLLARFILLAVKVCRLLCENVTH
jgi:hypothetical protein